MNPEFREILIDQLEEAKGDIILYQKQIWELNKTIVLLESSVHDFKNEIIHKIRNIENLRHKVNVLEEALKDDK